MENLLSTILLLGAIQGTILSGILFFSKHHITSNRILGSAIFFVSIALLFAYFQVELNPLLYTFQVKSSILFPLIFIPFIYLFTRLNTRQQNRIGLSDLKLFVPVFAVFAYNIPFYFGPPAEKQAYFNREETWNTLLLADHLEILFISIVVLGFALLMVRMILSMRGNFEKELSNYQEAVFNLMFLLVWLTLIFAGIEFILSLLQIANVTYPSFLNYLTALGSSALIYFIGYYTLLHPNIFHPAGVEKSNPEPLPTLQPISTAKSQKNEPDYATYYAQILLVMEEEKLYRKETLTLQDFANAVNLPAYVVSKTINTEGAQNFYNFVNHYRIEEVKYKLLQTESPHILQIAFAAGFNTKSSFYNYFKKQTGVSPSAFIKQKY